ncbi:hypothetical protein F5Y10DRAFT_292627 [Nemania abortiva]|nr:hypothetical protein F5Y10DRAFT_292627 [Nemania abortiva]
MSSNQATADIITPSHECTPCVPNQTLLNHSQAYSNHYCNNPNHLVEERQRWLQILHGYKDIERFWQARKEECRIQLQTISELIDGIRPGMFANEIMHERPSKRARESADAASNLPTMNRRRPDDDSADATTNLPPIKRRRLDADGSDLSGESSGAQYRPTPNSQYCGRQQSNGNPDSNRLNLLLSILDLVSTPPEQLPAELKVMNWSIAVLRKVAENALAERNITADQPTNPEYLAWIMDVAHYQCCYRSSQISGDVVITVPPHRNKGLANVPGTAGSLPLRLDGDYSPQDVSLEAEPGLEGFPELGIDSRNLSPGNSLHDAMDFGDLSFLKDWNEKGLPDGNEPCESRMNLHLDTPSNILD